MVAWTPLIVAVVLILAALAMYKWIIPGIAGPRDVVRVFEHGTDYGPARFADADIQKSAAAYICPVLFPLDLIMMTLWAAGLALGSVTLGASVSLVATGWIVLLSALPAVYFVSDLVEDLMLVCYLKNPAAATDSRVDLLKIITKMKVRSLIVAHIVFVGLAIALAVVAAIKAS